MAQMQQKLYTAAILLSLYILIRTRLRHVVIAVKRCSQAKSDFLQQKKIISKIGL